jgi:hypothetical protein
MPLYPGLLVPQSQLGIATILTYTFSQRCLLSTADTRGGVSTRTFHMAALFERLEAGRLIFQYILHLAGINIRRSLSRDPPTWTVINARAHSVPHRTVLAVIMGTRKRLLRKMSAQATAVRDHQPLTLVSPWSYTRLPTSTNFTDTLGHHAKERTHTLVLEIVTRIVGVLIIFQWLVVYHVRNYDERLAEAGQFGDEDFLHTSCEYLCLSAVLSAIRDRCSHRDANDWPVPRFAPY